MDLWLLAMTGALLAALVCVCLLPISADSAEDHGDGRACVTISPHVRTSPYRPRTWAFLAIAAVGGFVFLGWQRPSPAGLYVDAVRAVATAITRNPASVNGYVARLLPATQFFAVTYIVAISVVLRASLARRLAIVSHAVLYLAMSLLLDVLMVVCGMATGWPVAPLGIEATLANLLVGGLVVMRLTFTTFALPRATTVPARRSRQVWDDILACCALAVVVALVFAVYAFIAQPANLTTAWQVFVPL